MGGRQAFLVAVGIISFTTRREGFPSDPDEG